MKRYVSIILLMLIVLSTIGYAQSGMEDFTDAKNIIASKASCESLNDSQFEKLGDYYMELMHPNNHEQMDSMMGGEGSESLKLMHISMGKRFYCGGSTEFGMMGAGMMGSGYGMMGGYNGYGNYNGYNMMAGYGSGISLYNILYIVLLIGLIVLVYLGIVKLWKK